jgi:hypothetical protein
MASPDLRREATMKAHHKVTACLLSTAILLVVARSAHAAYTWKVKAPAKNAVVKWANIPCDLTLGWGGNDPRPTQIEATLIVMGGQYGATKWLSQTFNNTANPATLSGSFTTNFAALGNHAGAVRFTNWFNAMPNSSCQDVPVTVTQ